ncbi:MAG: hypothetical protein ACKVIN_16460 [Longimicrobiales bacterium]
MQPRRLIPCLMVVLGVLALSVEALSAQEVPPPREQVRVLLQAFSFDRALADRGGLVIGVLYANDSSEAEAIRLAFEELGADGIQDLPVTAIAVQVRSAALLIETFNAEGVTAVYVPENLSLALSSIQQVTRALGLPSVAGGRRLVQLGISMGVFLSGTGTRLIVNERSMQIENVDLPAQVLVVAEVIR